MSVNDRDYMRNRPAPSWREEGDDDPERRASDLLKELLAVMRLLSEPERVRRS